MESLQFRARKDNKLEKKIKAHVDDLNCNDGKKKIPIVFLKDNKYMMGLKACNIHLRGEQVQVRVGGGFENLGEWMDKNYEEQQRKIIQRMRYDG